MRVSKQKRKKNALTFWNILMNGSCEMQAIVIRRFKASNSNPNVHRVQFIVSNFDKPVVIAESNVLGADGCFMELYGFITGGFPHKHVYEPDFNKWLIKNLGVRITYKDGLVVMIERNK